MNINERGYWENNDLSGHRTDTLLTESLKKFFYERAGDTVVDFGCGSADYAKSLIEQGVSCECFDGNPYTEILTNGLAKTLDLSKEFYFDKTYDYVICLEVGEHIPSDFENILLDNLCNHANKGIILSWAIPGQPGDGHVNCRTNQYIKDVMLKRGWNSNENLESEFRKNIKECYWFKNTIMIFEK